MSAQRVLVFLALHRRALTRSFVSQALWLESTESHADGNLRHALWRIGKVEPSLIEKSSGHLALGSMVDVDLHKSTTLARRLQSDPESVDESKLREGMLVEDLLPDWHEEWVLHEQQLYRQLRLHALESMCLRLGRLHGTAGPSRAGLPRSGWGAPRGAGQPGFDASVSRRRNVSEALRQFRSFETLLQEELGVAPSQGFRQAFESLKVR
jgi:DNA-binding SARP family transcriptional activator